MKLHWSEVTRSLAQMTHLYRIRLKVSFPCLINFIDTYVLKLKEHDLTAANSQVPDLRKLRKLSPSYGDD